MKRACLYVFIFLFAVFLGWLGVQQAVPPFHGAIFLSEQFGEKSKKDSVGRVLDLSSFLEWQQWKCGVHIIDLPTERFLQCFSPEDHEKLFPKVLVRFVGQEEPFLLGFGRDRSKPVDSRSENIFFAVKTKDGWRLGDQGGRKAQVVCDYEVVGCMVKIFKADGDTIKIETIIPVPEGTPWPLFPHKETLDSPQYLGA